METIHSYQFTSTKTPEEIEQFLRSKFNLKDAYVWWNPFAKNKGPYEGVFKGEKFKITENQNESFHFERIVFGRFWKIVGKINVGQKESKIVIKAGYNIFGKTLRMFVLLLTFFALFSWIWGVYAFLNGLIIAFMSCGWAFYLVPNFLERRFNQVKELMVQLAKV